MVSFVLVTGTEIAAWGVILKPGLSGGILERRVGPEE